MAEVIGEINWLSVAIKIQSGVKRSDNAMSEIFCKMWRYAGEFAESGIFLVAPAR